MRANPPNDVEYAVCDSLAHSNANAGSNVLSNADTNAKLLLEAVASGLVLINGGTGLASGWIGLFINGLLEVVTEG